MTIALPRTAPAALNPCQMYRDHGSSYPVRTQGHHRYPQYLQKRLYGSVTNTELLWLCGTCHDSIHAWLDYLLGEAYKPNPEPPFRIRTEAEYVFAWFQKEQAT